MTRPALSFPCFSPCCAYKGVAEADNGKYLGDRHESFGRDLGRVPGVH